MSKFTTELRFICETESGLTESKGFNDVENIISNARTKIFNFSYPIFDDAYKEQLETKILRHYYTREIGEETYGLWKLRLSTKLNDIMPYYNKMYESTMLEFNPLYDIDMRENKDSNHNTDTTNTINSNGKQMYSDTPQGAITDLTAEKYLTSANYDVNQSSSNGNEKTIDNYLTLRQGRNKSGSKLIKEYREILLNIDLMIIDELKDLFFGLWE